MKTPASNSLRDPDMQIVILNFSPMWKPWVPGSDERDAGAGGFLTGSFRHFLVPSQSENIFAGGVGENAKEYGRDPCKPSRSRF
jgi:hypothetical protein